MLACITRYQPVRSPKARVRVRIVALPVTAMLLIAAIWTVAVPEANATTVTTTSYALPGCTLLHDTQQPSLPPNQPNHPYACLYYGVNATQANERVSPVSPYYDWYSGYYYNGSSWIQGSAGYVYLCNFGGCGGPTNASLLTNVVYGTAEQVGTWLFSNDPFYLAY